MYNKYFFVSGLELIKLHVRTHSLLCQVKGAATKVPSKSLLGVRGMEGSVSSEKRSAPKI